MEFLPADYALGGLTIVMAVLGLFRGFSGTLAFVLACGAASFAGAFAWSVSEQFVSVVWQRGALTLVATLLAFGLVRLTVKKMVGGLLAQPSDAIFGFLVGAFVGLLVAAVWAWSGKGLEYSNLVREVSNYVR